MSEDTNVNPYEAPQSEVEKVSNTSAINIFPRFSAWGVFGLSLITLGIYAFYWMISRAGILNKNTDDKISQGFITTAIILYIVAFFGSFVDVIDPNAVGLIMAMSIVSLVSAIWNIVLIFKIRNRINAMTNSEPGSTTWMGGVLTFLFAAIYVQYKINEMIDMQDS